MSVEDDDGVLSSSLELSSDDALLLSYDDTATATATSTAAGTKGTSPPRPIMGERNAERLTPEASASIFSRSFFMWLDALMALGNERDIDIDDIYQLEAEHEADASTAKLEEAWEAEKKVVGREPSLIRALFQAFWWSEAVYAIPFRIIKVITDFLPPLIVKLLIQFVQGDAPSESLWYGLFLTLVLGMLAIFRSMALMQFWTRMARVGNHMRNSLTCLVYKKVLKLPMGGLKDVTSGKVVNLISNDQKRVMELSFWIHFGWSGPLMAILTLFMSLFLIGPAGTAGGFSAALFLLPMSYYFNRKLGDSRVETIGRTDVRVSRTTDVFQNMKNVKMSALEPVFSKLVLEHREDEVEYLKKYRYIQAILSAINLSFTPLMILGAFVGYYIAGGILTAPIAFSIMSAYAVIRIPLALFSQALCSFVEARVSCERFQEFLLTDEIDHPVHLISPSAAASSDSNKEVEKRQKKQKRKRERDLLDSSSSSSSSTSSYDDGLMDPPLVVGVGALVPSSSAHSYAHKPLKVIDADFSWSRGGESVLSGINLEIEAGQLVCIIGESGAGKSSLLASLLGELYLLGGSVSVPDSMSFVSQESYLINGTIKENILFSLPLEEHRYKQTVKACALLPDFASLPNSDGTLVGERGITLSGGQKARITLARAVYSRSSVLLLDDPLSAVDVHVGSYLFDRCINGVLSNRTRVLVTHQLQYVSKADSIIVLNDGKVIHTGTYSELATRGYDISQFLSTKDDADDEGILDGVEGEEDIVMALDGSASVGRDEAGGDGGGGKALSLTQSQGSLADSGILGGIEEGVEEEEKEDGKVSLSLYLDYFKKSPWSWGFSFVLTLALYSSTLWRDFWLSHMTTLPAETYASSLTLYVLIAVFVSLLLVAREFALVQSSLASSLAYHKQLFASLMVAQMQFFDTTPLGRIMVRFSTDIDNLDSLLPPSIARALLSGCTVIITVIILVAMSFWTLIPVFLLAFASYKMQQYYLNPFRELNRIKSITKSPPVSLVGETMVGLSTVRAYKLEREFYERLCGALRDLTKCDVFLTDMNRWLGMRTSILGAIFLSLTFGFAILFKDSIPPASLGLALVYGLRMSTYMTWFVRDSAQIETYMNSVERLEQYIKLEHESASVSAEGSDISLPIPETYTDLDSESESESGGDSGSESNSESRSGGQDGGEFNFEFDLLGRKVESSQGETEQEKKKKKKKKKKKGMKEKRRREGDLMKVGLLDDFQSASPSLSSPPSHSSSPSSSTYSRSRALSSLKQWPTKGEIRFEGVRMRYREDLPLVLHDLTFHVQGAEKIGIVGRTGAGKSSLITAIFRLVSLERGRILIDNVDISTVPLPRLRSSISIISQSPAIYQGTLRFNLTRGKEQYSDKELWNVLKMVHLKQWAASLPEKLETEMSENGTTMSAGQRQLFCISRALLDRSQIIILDEASASIDPETAQLLQLTLKSEFADCTVLTIAHRLQTIANDDRVLVLDKGSVLEFDTPLSLIQRGGVFAEMMEHATLKS